MSDDSGSRETGKKAAGWPELLFPAFFLAVFLGAVVQAVTQFDATGVVVPEEFALLEQLLRVLPVLRGAYVALCLLSAAVAAWAYVRAGREPGAARRLGIPLVLSFLASAVLFPLLVICAVLMFAGVVVQWRGDVASDPALRESVEGICRRWRGVRLSGAAEVAGIVLAAGCVVGVGISLMEGYLHVWSTVKPFFAYGAFADFLEYAAGNAMVYGAVRGAGLVVILGAFLGIAALLLRGRRIPEWSGPVLLVAFVCAFAFVLVIVALHFAYGEEMEAVGLWRPAQLIFATLFVALAALGVRNVRLIAGGLKERAAPDRTFRQDVLDCLVGVVFFPLAPCQWIRRRMGRPCVGRLFPLIGAIGLLSLLSFCLLYLNYPTLHDYSHTAVHFYTTVMVVTMVVLATLAVYLPFPRLRLPWPAGVAVNGVLGGVAVLLLAMGEDGDDQRVMFHEYSVINHVFKKQFAPFAYGHQSRLGMEESRDEEFAFHPPGFTTLPEQPGIKAFLEPRPIVLILVDALRADRLEAYGGTGGVTPNIDALARDCVVFGRAYAPGTATTCSLRCLFTGRYSSRYFYEEGIPPFFLKDLIHLGYRRFLMSVWKSELNGISMDAFRRGLSPEELEGTLFVGIPARADPRKTDDAIRKLEAARAAAGAGPRGDGGWLLYLHLTATHFPWVVREIGTPRGTRQEDLYDHNVSYSDHAVGRLVEHLKAEGIYDDAVIVVMADHGTGLMEHGRYGGFFCYEEQIRVPLLIKVPGISPRRVEETVSLVDVGPTLVNLFRRGTPNRFHGISLLPLMTGRVQRSGRAAVFNICSFNDAYGIVYRDRWKYIFHRMQGYRLLFDLSADPGETRNLVRREAAMEERLRSLLAAFLWEGRDSYGNPYHFKPFRIGD